MSKVASEDNSAELRYAHFLGAYLKERLSAYFLAHPLTSLADDSKAFIEAFKFLFNSSGALVETQISIPEQVCMCSVWV
jgi:hypothetical protein